mgnify:CR=1 FL=1
MKQYHTHYSALTSLGVPIIVGQIGIIILGFADRLPIDWHSTLEFAVVAFVNNMFVLVLYYFAADCSNSSAGVPPACFCSKWGEK